MLITIDNREKTAVQKRHWVRLTYICNNNCLFCLDKNSQKNKHISLQEIKRDLKKGIKSGCERVILSGGEATMHPDFYEIIRLARKAGYSHVQAISNGRLFAYKKFLDEAIGAGINEITFSIHGHNAQLHDFQTQAEGSFNQTLLALKRALNISGLIVSVDIVISAINCRYLYDILNFFINLGVREFDLLQIIPFGQAWQNKRILFYDIEKNLSYIHKALQFSKFPDVVIWTNRFPPKYLEGFEELIQNPHKMSDEVRGRRNEFLGLIQEGKMMSCRGEKCQYCFLQGFCADLIELKNKKCLTSRKLAGCQKTVGRTKCVSFLLKNNFNIYDFLDFYIKNRYYVKSVRCRSCLSNDKCDGAWIEDIRKKGFRILEPDKANVGTKQSLQLLNNKPENDRSIKHIEINIGKICNNKCIFCKGAGTKEFFVSADKIKKEIDTMSDKGYLSLGLLGGEPTIYPGIENIISYARLKGFAEIHIITNGRKLADMKFLHMLVRSGATRISVSVHSHLAEIEDKLTGIKGGFSQKIAGLENLVELKKNNKLSGNVAINIVINKYNYENLDKTIIFFKKMGLSEFRLNFVRPDGLCLIDFDRIVPRFREFSKYIERILKLADYKTIGVTISDVPICLMPKKLRKPELMGELGDYFNLVVAFKQNKDQVKETFSWKQMRQNNLKIKGPRCHLCSFNNICEGIWKVYGERKGFSELRPIK